MLQTTKRRKAPPFFLSFLNIFFLYACSKARARCYDQKRIDSILCLLLFPEMSFLGENVCTFVAWNLEGSLGSEEY